MLRIIDRKDSASFAVKVIPRASRNELGGIEEGVLRVRLTAPPVGGAANKALTKLLAQILRVPERDVEIVTGHTGRQKLVAVAGLTSQEVQARLEAHLPDPAGQP